MAAATGADVDPPAAPAEDCGTRPPPSDGSSGSEDLELEGARVTVTAVEAPGGLGLTLWTDAEGVVLLEWQVAAAPGGPWQPPPRPWPAQSGLDGAVLQTALGGGGAAGGQRVALAPGPWSGLRWRLLCVGPPLQRLPAEMRPLAPPAPAPGASGEPSEPRPEREGVSPPVAAADAGDSDSDSDAGRVPGAVVRLRLGLGRGGQPVPEARVALGAPPTLGALRAQAAGAFPEQAAAGLLGEAVGAAAGVAMPLDSDAALAIFLSYAGASQMGPPVVEIRTRHLELAGA